MHVARLPLAAALVVALGPPGLAAGGAAGDVPQLSAATPAATATLGHDRIGVRRGEQWLLRDSLEGGPARSYREGPAWRAVAGDTDGDGDDSLHLFKDGVWLLRDAEGAFPRVVHFGAAGDVPLLGDWDGDGTDTLALFRAGRWSLRDGNGLTGTARVFGFGSPGDVPVVGDWDADGDSDVAVRRGATWFQRDASTPGPASRRFEFGRPGDVPVAGDWDHDGRDAPGLFRNGTWLFRTSGPERYVTTQFGARGDQPVVRRTRGLAPGVRHRVLRNRAVPYTAHVATVDLAAASSPDTVLAQDRLRGLEVVSSMARRTGAVLAVNGDYALGDGRPVHLFASDGQLAQSPQLLGRALSLDARGTQVRMGFPDLRLALTATGVPGALAPRLTRFNSAGPVRDELAAFTAVGAGLPGPPREACYAALRPAGGRTMAPDGTVRSPLQVTGARCGGAPAAVPPSGALLAGDRASAFLRSLRPGQAVQLAAQLGFSGAVDVLGGNPLLVVDGRVVDADVDGSGAFFARNPRTAVGVTANGSLLVVVVDGRQRAYSSGATLRETAELMRALGAVTAINLDGGGSSEMWVNGLVVTRPSDGRERGVSSALTVLRGADTGQSGLAPAQPSGSGAAASDPGSTGGLLDALRRDGVPLPPELRAVAERFAG